jgi:hypothetical protein
MPSASRQKIHVTCGEEITVSYGSKFHAKMNRSNPHMLMAQRINCMTRRIPHAIVMPNDCNFAKREEAGVNPP